MDDADALVWLDRAERDAMNLPAPGSGTGRPCYIAHDHDYPENECDGIHGVAAITAFYAVEDAMTGPDRFRPTTIERPTMDKDRERMHPLAALGILALFLAVILAFAFGVAAFFKFVM